MHFKKSICTVLKFLQADMTSQPDDKRLDMMIRSYGCEDMFLELKLYLCKIISPTFLSTCFKKNIALTYIHIYKFHRTNKIFCKNMLNLVYMV